MYCTEHSLVKYGDRARLIVTLWCRSWQCENCHDSRRRGLVENAIAGKPDTFLTLTCRRNRYETPDAAAQALSQAWRLVRKRAVRAAQARTIITSKRERPRGAPGFATTDGDWSRPAVILSDPSLPFLAVIERHQSGWPHLHILTRTVWLDQEWVSDQMRDILGSPVVDIRRARRRKQVAWYCAKYVGKEPYRFRSTKRYWQSKNYRIEPQRAHPRDPSFPGAWERQEFSFARLIRDFACAGWTIEQSSQYRAIARAPP